MSTEEHPPEDARPKTGDAQSEADDTGAANPETGDAADETLPRLIAALSGHLGEIRVQLERLLNVQVDRLRLKARAGLFWLLLTLVFGTVCVVATVAAVQYLLAGVAGFLTSIFGGNTWAGDLSTGGGVLLIILLAVLILGRGFRKRELEKLRRKYESDSAKGDAR